MLVIAHRGACRRAAENTVAAFRIAIELGADGVEFDVRRSLDGVLVIHHDASIDGVGPIVEHTFASLRALRPAIPTLAETLDVVGAMTLINIEMKCCAWEPDADADGVVARGVANEIAARGLHANAVVSSFDLVAVDQVHALDPAIETGWLVQGVDPAVAVATAQDHGHGWLHPDWGNLHLRLASSVEAAGRYGIRLDTWTVDDPAVLREFAAAGVEAAITNVPEIGLAATRPSVD